MIIFEKKKYMKKYLVTYWEDEFSCIAEIKIEAENEDEIRAKANKYYEENLLDTNVGGAKWDEIYE